MRKQPDVAVWGAPPQRTSRFSLNRYLPSGGTERLRIPGDDGLMHYDWPVARLSVDWIRDRWGAGRFQANWLVDEDGRRVPRGKSRVIDILGGGARARARENGAPVAFGDGHSPAPAAPPAPMPTEVVDMRVKAAEDIAALRLKTERELHQERLEWERTKSEERFKRLEESIDELRSGRGRDDDDDDEPSEWQWLKDLVGEFTPTLKQFAPLLLAKLEGKTIVGGGGG